MRELALGARLTLAGGRAGLVRTTVTAFTIGLGVVVLLVASSLPAIHGDRQARDGARVGTVGIGPALLVAEVPTAFRTQELSGRLVEPAGPGGRVGLLPPGLTRLPRPGEVFVSPALRDLLATTEGRRLVAPRIPGRVVGTIGDDGLLAPSELGYYAGARGLGAEARRVIRFGGGGGTRALPPLLGLLTVLGLVAVLLPVAVLVGAAVRTGGEERDRRLAALRLVGADHAMTRRVAAGEALVAAGLGLVLGALLFLVVRANAGRLTLWELSVFQADVRPSLPLVALVVAGVPAAAVLVSLLALRRVVAEPLGVVRRAQDSRRRRLWWRLLLPAAGLLILATASADSGELRIAAGTVALLIGVAALLPWVVERVVARLGGGAVAWQLAVRRLQLDPGGPARTVSGVAVAVAGAIALQMVLTGVQQDFKAETREDPSRATVHAAFGDVPAAAAGARLAAAQGARTAVAIASYGQAESAVHVAPCAALRELIRASRCADGDVFRSPRASSSWPGARTVRTRRDPLGRMPGGIFATPSAARGKDLGTATVDVWVRVDPDDPDAVEHVRNAAAAISPQARVQQLRRTRTDAEFDLLRRALLAGAAIAIALIGCGLLLTALDQLRERRRLLAVLVAFGTRTSTLAWSVLWQSAVPVALALALAVSSGLALGAVLQRLLDTPIHVGWGDVAGMAAVGAAVVLAVTAATLPLLWRTMRPDGLRWE